jgi:hypothetical protein
MRNRIMSSVTSQVAHGSRGGAHHGGRRLRRVGVGVFFGSVAVNAVLGIAALLVGDFSETHGRVLGTSLSVTGALLLGLACLPAWERERLGALPLVGAALGAAAFALVVVSIWTGGDSDVLGKAMGTLMTLAVGCALACVLALPPLAPPHRPVLLAALVLTAIAAGFLVGAIWIEPESGWYPRLFGVVGVLLAATSVSVPVVGRIDRAAVEQGTNATVVAFCPFCGASVVEGSEPTCDGCGRRFSVRALG